MVKPPAWSLIPATFFFHVKKFDPIKKREVADEFELAWVLETELEPDMPMGNVMASHLNDVVALTLAGYGGTVAPVLPTFIDWLKDAIEKTSSSDAT